MQNKTIKTKKCGCTTTTETQLGYTGDSLIGSMRGIYIRTKLCNKHKLKADQIALQLIQKEIQSIVKYGEPEKCFKCEKLMGLVSGPDLNGMKMICIKCIEQINNE